MDLRRLILALTIASALISLANTFYASYQVQRQLLIENALESNHAYATKLAASTEDFLSGVQQQLKVSAAAIATNFKNKNSLEAEAERLRLQTGAIGGTIYLKQASILNQLLGKHYYNDGSYIYVVDKNKRIIYHPEIKRVGKVINSNPVINKLTEQKSATLAALDSLMVKVVSKTLPIALLSLLIIWWCAKLISRPLRQLADSANAMDRAETEQKIQDVRSWYFESSELKRVMLAGINILHKNINKLKDDVQTDPLTGLGNRRCMELALSLWKSAKTPFSVVTIDIDFFKRVNDTFGHDVGDLVLQKLAQYMRDVSRVDDVICRVGGEEFLMLLPKTNSQTATQVAERLRSLVESSIFDFVGKITVSLGVANWPDSSNEILMVLKAADEMLYKAKKYGRSRVEVFLSAYVAGKVITP